MNIVLSSSAEKDFRRLPSPIKKKAHKQLKFLITDASHPSLRLKKMPGREGVWEARIDYHWRMTFQKEGDTLIVRKLGPHDEGLGKK